SFLNNTIVNQYKIIFLQPNLGIFWYINSLIFKEYYYAFLFFFHFHVFFYPIPLLFRLMKTPLIYLQIMVAITLIFEPNITINDVVYCLLLMSIDYEKTLCNVPFAKLFMIMLTGLGLFCVTTNLWLHKNTANANYVYAYQLLTFNIITNTLNFYIKVQTPIMQLEEGKSFVVSKNRKKLNFLEALKETLS
ncbi:GPI transamidase subunit PIG-U, putative, partial [Hepatocystis sp. ex Piliocolobus tephrosceles]